VTAGGCFPKGCDGWARFRPNEDASAAGRLLLHFEVLDSFHHNMWRYGNLKVVSRRACREGRGGFLVARSLRGMVVDGSTAISVFQGTVDETFAAFGIAALYTPAGGEAVSVRVIARRPDTIVGLGETHIHAETATFEVRASEVANPRPQDQLTISGKTFVVQGEPGRRDPDRLVWTLDVRRP
jgi:hypothetical protein